VIHLSIVDTTVIAFLRRINDGKDSDGAGVGSFSTDSLGLACRYNALATALNASVMRGNEPADMPPMCPAAAACA
jgi:hypothetical protein